MASLTQWTWVWANSGSWWWTGRPGVLQSMGLQSQTWLSNWTELIHVNKLSFVQNSCFELTQWRICVLLEKVQGEHSSLGSITGSASPMCTLRVGIPLASIFMPLLYWHPFFRGSYWCPLYFARNSQNNLHHSPILLISELWRARVWSQSTPVWS